MIGTLHIFLQNLEKSRQNAKSISQIKNLEGNIVSETNDILYTVHDYYKQLFSCVQTEDESIHVILQLIHASVDENNVEMCDEDISISEIYKSLNGMSKGKTPGPDGLTSEFYLYFFLMSCNPFLNMCLIV